MSDEAVMDVASGGSTDTQRKSVSDAAVHFGPSERSMGAAASLDAEPGFGQ